MMLMKRHDASWNFHDTYEKYTFTVILDIFNVFSIN